MNSIMEPGTEEDLTIVVLDPSDKKYKNLSNTAKLIYNILLREYAGKDNAQRGDETTGIINDIRYILGKYKYRDKTIYKGIQELKNKKIIRHTVIAELDK